MCTIGPVCTGCHRLCETAETDFGIGPYEYWGATGVHVDIQTVSTCCEAPAVDDIADLTPPSDNEVYESEVA